MDHDALVTFLIPGPALRRAMRVLPGMALDESYIWEAWPPEQFPTSELGYLQTIYRVGKDLDTKRPALARIALTNAYKKTQHELLTNHKLRPFFHEVFVKRLLDWDTLVEGYLQIAPHIDASTQWKEEMNTMLARKRYDKRTCDEYMEVMENHRAFLERQGCLFGVDQRKIVDPDHT